MRWTVINLPLRLNQVTSLQISKRCQRMPMGLRWQGVLCLVVYCKFTVASSVQNVFFYHGFHALYCLQTNWFIRIKKYPEKQDFHFYPYITMNVFYKISILLITPRTLYSNIISNVVWVKHDLLHICLLGQCSNSCITESLNHSLYGNERPVQSLFNAGSH